MTIAHIWLSANPELNEHLRRANEARAAAFYAAFKSVTGALAAPIRRFAEHLRRARRARQTYRALRELSDYQLRDIGLHRSEILGVSRAVADHADATLAELRGMRSATVDRDETIVPFSSGGRRPARPGEERARAA